jgi:DnaK suppressor protein
VKNTVPETTPAIDKASPKAAKPAAKAAVKLTPVTVAKSAAPAAAKKAATPHKVATAVAVPAPPPEPKVSKVLKAGTRVPVVPAPGAKRGRRAASAPLPTPQPEPSHSPDAAKATFSNTNERVMNFPVHSPARKNPQLANNWKNKPVDQLTDEEVLSMADDDYMNDAQMAFFRLKLVRLKTDILASAGETTEHLREDTVVVPDPADRATIEEEHALELRTRDRERKLLKKIEQSIARIDSGDYGYCDETGEPIGVGRLLARPTASLSLEAQQRRELKQKMFGD